MKGTKNLGALNLLPIFILYRGFVSGSINLTWNSVKKYLCSLCNVKIHQSMLLFFVYYGSEDYKN